MITHTGIVHRILFPSMLWRMPGKKVYLTFDDGPHSRATPAVLNCLKQHQVHATFFLSGKNIQGNEAIVRRIMDEGHSIGIHAYSHTRMLAFSKEQTMNEIRLTQTMLAAIVPQKIRLFRPPFGFFSWKTIAAARELGFVLVMWSCLSGDFRSWKNARIVETTLTGLSHGSIVVFHDNDLTEHKIVELLDKVIPEINRHGFELGAIR